MPEQLIQAPALEPISLAEAKNHLRVDTDLTEDDLLIGMMISAARGIAERFTKRAIITQQWKVFLDIFPNTVVRDVNQPPLAYSYSNSLGPYASPVIPQRARDGYAIVLPWPRLISVESVKYIDTAGVQQTLSPSVYTVDGASEPGRIVPAWGQVWPITRYQINAIEISFTAGYGPASTDVPAEIRMAILEMVADMYDSRAPVPTTNALMRMELALGPHWHGRLN